MARIRISPAGLRAALNGAQVRKAVHDAAEAMADHIRAEGIRVGDRDGGPYEIPLPVVVRDSTVDGLPVSTVVLDHPAGQAVQMKHGSLTIAATSAGLKLRSKGLE
jgi:hypothetical protein